MSSVATEYFEPPAGRPDGANTEPVEVLLVDDDRWASYSLWALLNWQPGIRVIGRAHTAAEALALVSERRPQVCLVAAGLEVGQGLALVQRLLQGPEAGRVIVYDDRPDADLYARALSAGAAAVFCRYDDPALLAQEIRKPAEAPAIDEAAIDVDQHDPVTAAHPMPSARVPALQSPHRWSSASRAR